MSDLKKFKDMLGGGSGEGAVKEPPYALKASDLDNNFELCYPRPVDGNNAGYTIDRSVSGGWRLKGQRIFDVCENGQAVRYRFFAERLADVST
jgi:hypothetical protein